MIWFLARYVIVLALFIVAVPAQAESVVRSGETVSVASDQVVSGDFYAAASVVNVSGKVEQDFIAAGGKVTLNGSVEEDALLIAGAVDVHGTVAEDVRIIAGEAVIAEPVAGNVMVISGRLEVLSTASIGGDVLIFGGDATIEGSVGGDIIGHIGQIRIDAPVGGDVNISTNQLTLGDRASIAGSVMYTSEQVIVRSQNAEVIGEVLRNDPVATTEQVSSYRTILLPILAFLFSALVWFLLSRHTLERVTDQALHLPMRSSLIGFLAVFGAPVMVTILLASVIGFHVGLIALLLYIVSILLGVITVIPLVGSLILKVLNKKKGGLSILTLLVGTVTAGAVLWLPVLGFFVWFGFCVLGVGAIVDAVGKRIRG